MVERSKVHKTLLNLKRALKDEKKGTSFYEKVAEVAKAEGMLEASTYFRNAAKDCKRHAAEIENVLYNLGD